MTFADHDFDPDPGLADLTRRIGSLKPDGPTFIVGITGSVAVGKSTFARALASLLRRPDRAAVEVAATDGFLLPNAILDERGLTLRKGFPESFDVEAMATALSSVRKGSVTFPAYSHVTYDIDPDLADSSIAAPRFVEPLMGIADGALATLYGDISHGSAFLNDTG